MSRKHARKIEQARTSFARWRAQLALTQQEAADKLGKSRRAIVAYETGNPPVIPDLGTRVLMQMLAHGKETPSPWPE